MVRPRWVFGDRWDGLLYGLGAETVKMGARFRYPCRDQCDSRQKVASQPHTSIPRRLATDTEAPWPHRTGLTTDPWTLTSFILTKSPAGFTGSSPLTEAAQARAY